MKGLVLGFGIVLCMAAAVSSGNVMCYWGAWANARPGLASFGVDDLPLDLCTHLIYAFVGLNPAGEITDLNGEEVVNDNSNLVSDFIALKGNAPNTKFILSIGGWTEGTTNFTAVVNNDTLRATFVANILKYIQDNNYDGLSVDWEYPNQRGGVESDKQAFVTLLQELKAAFADNNYHLSVAVGASESNIDLSYLVSEISAAVDIIQIMSYDFHGSWDTVTGVNAPLYAQLTDAEGSTVNVNSAVTAWINNGAEPSKIVLGVGAYGKSFNLTSLDNVSTGAPVTGAADGGPYTQEAGTYAYYEICLSQNENQWNITEVDGSYVYGNFGNLWVGYDNQNTIAAKGKYAKDLGLGGIMVWAVDLDDFSNVCGQGKYPLITAAANGFNDS